MTRTAVALVLVAGTALGQQGPIRTDDLDDAVIQAKWNIFALYNECRPMRVTVSEISRSAVRIGVSRSRLLSAVRGRLEAVGLHSETAQTSLRIRVSVHDVGLYVRAEYRKMAFDYQGTLNVGPMTTWNSGSTGIHNGDPGIVLEEVMLLVDRSSPSTSGSTRRTARSGMTMGGSDDRRLGDYDCFLELGEEGRLTAYRGAVGFHALRRVV